MVHPIVYGRFELMFEAQRIPRELRNRIKDIRAPLVRLAMSWCGNQALADDLAQEALTMVIRKHHQLREYEKFDRWVFTILSNCWREHLRREKTTYDIDEVVLYDPRETEDETTKIQVIEKVRQAVAKLPNGQRQVITLVDLQGFSYADVAEVLDIPTGTVMSRLSRARQTLKDHLLTLQKEVGSTKNHLRSVQ